MNLCQGLRLERNDCLAFVGAGGKTTAMFRVARQLFAIPDPPATVLVTTTTQLGVSQAAMADHHLVLPVSMLAAGSLPLGVVLFTAGAGAPGKLAGIGADVLLRLREISLKQNLPLLIEADGARQKPLKAPASHEPAIPDFATMVVVVVGLSGLGKPLEEGWVHRSQRFAELAGLLAGERITAQSLANLLLHPEGGLKNIPAGARRVVLLNQADTPELASQAQALAGLLLPIYQAVLIARLEKPEETSAISMGVDPNGEVLSVHEPAAGIVLAAGSASRFGQPKLLVEWQGKPLVRHAVLQAMQAGLDPVVVVTGSNGDQVQQALKGLEVIIAHNPDWEQGQSSSIRAGMAALLAEIGSVAILLADQPLVQADLIRGLVETHASSLAEVVAPWVDGRQGNPVLFDRALFSELKQLQGDAGGRTLFDHHTVTWMPWRDRSPLVDIDTPEDYKRLVDAE